MKTTECTLAVLTAFCLLFAASPLHEGIAQEAVADESASAVLQRFESSSEPIAVVAEIVADKSQVATPMQYTVTVEAPRGATVVFPPIAGVSINETEKLTVVDQPLGDFLLTRVEVRRDVPTGATDGTRRTTLLLGIESLKAGVRNAPPLEVAYRLAGQSEGTTDVAREGTVRIPALGVEIKSVLVSDDAPDKFRDIKTPIASPVVEQGQSSLLLALLVTGIGALCACWFWWTRRRKNVKPEQWALQRIAELEQLHRANQISQAEVYGDLSVVLRDYVQSSGRTPATALCTSEFLEHLNDAGFDPGVISEARSILTTADLSKFSPDVEISGEDGKSPFDQAKCVVNESVRRQRLDKQRQSRPDSPGAHVKLDVARKVEA